MNFEEKETFKLWPICAVLVLKVSFFEFVEIQNIMTKIFIYFNSSWKHIHNYNYNLFMKASICLSFQTEYL